MTRRRRPLFDWVSLVLTSGMAALITAIGSYALDFARRSGADAAKRCELAAAFLQDETPSPYLGQAEARRLTAAASARLERCLRQG